ncbi:NUDIX domain-containing protein [Streptomyces sp. NPDC052682]|uniref:NUDIX domain-containing protein n=1 Tax=Streptomyces sp. NPDC052682 TaxID=3154954 RepID=UPI0034445E94
MPLTPELPRISVSVKAAIVRDGAVLLLSYDDEAGFHYNLPGGKAQVGEDLRQAVNRKVAQETGLQVVARRQSSAVGGAEREARRPLRGQVVTLMDPTLKDLQEWLLREHSGTVCADRLSVIAGELADMTARGVPGAVVELGCYRGAMAL